MSWGPAPKLPVFLALAAAGLVAGLATGRVEPVALVAPLALAVAVDLALAAPPAVDVSVRLDKTRITEGETVVLDVTLAAGHDLPCVEVYVGLPAELASSAPNRPRGLSLQAGERRRLAFPVLAERWGSYELGDVGVRARSLLGLLEAEGRHTARKPLVVHPRPEALRRLVRAQQTQTAPGLQVARAVGDGIEFADARPFAPGDRVREVNWRITARRGALWVNQRHPDRSTDVVVLLDSFGASTLPVAVRAANSLVNAYLAHRDRVGLISFGGTVRWVRPGMGLRQQYVLVDALLATRVFASVAWKGISLIPPRVLPPKALVVAVSPLEDERAVTALVDLRDRGIDLVILEVSPAPFVAAPTDRTGDVAERLWQLRRAVLRDRYRELGVPTVEWREGTSLTEAVEEVRAWPHAARRPAG